MQDDNTLLRLSDSVTYQKMNAEGQTVILHLDSGTLFTCNDTTCDFLKVMDQGKRFGEIVEAMLEIYDIDIQTLKTDLSQIADRLLEKGIIVAQ